MEKQNSLACERNSAPILSVLKEIITEDNKLLLEIGSGTAQHALNFAPEFPYLKWVTSDTKQHLKTITSRVCESKICNISGPLEFEVGVNKFPLKGVDLIFTANTLHIMSWKQNKTLFKMLGENLQEGSQLIIYGPFKYNGEFTSTSNFEFDQWLKLKDVKSGIRSFEDVSRALLKNGFKLTKDYSMPANNQLLLFTKLEHNLLTHIEKEPV